MTDNDTGRDGSTGNPTDRKQQLRRLAESRLGTGPSDDLASLSALEIGDVVHDLRVHEIELEMQNEELRNAHATLDALRAKYFDLYELAPVGYLTIGAKGLILEANLTAAALLGRARSDLAGQALSRFIRPEDEDIYYLHRRNLDATGNPQVCDVRMTNKQGLEIWIRLESTLSGEDGDTDAVCRTTMSDITDRRALETRVAQADRLASVGLLAAGVAHEINNPLTFVLNNLESLSEDLPRLARRVTACRAALRNRTDLVEISEACGRDDEVTETAALEDLLERAAAAVDGAIRIRDITRGLSFFSRVSDSQRTLVDINQAAQHAIAMAAGEVRYRALVVTDFGAVPPVFASEGKLAQIFLNLIVNACQALEEGDAENNRIEVRTWSEGLDVCAEVFDTGPGIRAEFLDRVFDPFFTTKVPGRGTGLGLAISRSITTEFGGTIAVESDPGRGTRFTLRLPRSEEGAATEVKRVDHVTAANARGRILIVDDEEEVAAVLRRALAPHDIVLASSGEEGQTILARDTAFDLILCDLMMPRMTGMDLHRWLAETNPRLATRIVFMSGGVFTPRAARYLDSVGNRMLTKPFKVADLKGLVAEMVAAAQQDREDGPS